MSSNGCLQSVSLTEMTCVGVEKEEEQIATLKKKKKKKKK